MNIHIVENRRRVKALSRANVNMLCVFWGFLIGIGIAVIININKAQTSDEIKTILIYQADAQIEMISEIAGVRVAEDIRRKSHERALEMVMYENSIRRQSNIVY